MSTFAFAGIWEKLNNRDPDIKYVGCGDLLIELQKESFKFDKQQEKLLGDKLLDLLTGESSIGDVRSQAQTCIGPFVAKASDEQIKNMTDKLADFLMEEKVKDEQREISSYGLQTVIHSVNPRCGNLLVDRLARRIMGVLQNESTSPEVKGECMDRLVDLLARFGSIMSDLHADIVQIALAQLRTHRQNCRKKATGCLARVAVYLDDKLFSQLIETLVQCENNNPTGKHWYIRSCISTIKEISQSAGQRLSSFLPHVVPLLLRLCEGEADMRDSTSDSKHDEELREICFQTFESLNTRCPKDLPVHIPQIISHAVYSLKFDPNYIGDEDEFPNDEEFPEEDNPFGDSVDDAGFEDAGQDWEEIQQEFDDDEQLDSDMSWKVRKAAAKIIGSILKNRPEMLEELYETAIPALISRLKSEREEHVMLEVFQSLTYALRQTHKATTLQHKGPENQLRKLLPDIIHNITVALSPDKVKSPKWAQVRVGIFTLLKEILLVQEGTNANAATPGLTSSNSNNIVISRSERLDEQIGKHPDFPALMAAVVSALADKSSNLRIETLVFLRLLLQNLSAESFHPFIESLAPAIFDSVANNYYKIVAEALRVCAALVTVLRPLDHEVKFNYRPYAASIYESILPKLQAKDIDQEVKTAAITCAANIIATLGDCLPQQYLHDSLHILQDRLQNEITRLTTVRVLAKIAESPLNIQLDPILGESISRLASFLRQNNRQLRQSSLVTLDILIKHYGSNNSIPELLPALLTEVAGLVSAADLHLSHLALQLTTTVLTVHPNVATGLIKDLIFPRTLDLIESKVLQGLALQSLLNLLGELVRNDTAGFGFDDLLRSLLQLANQNDDLAKQSTTSVAQCIAALCVNTRSEQQLRQTVQSFIRKVSGKSETKDVVLSLLSLGEIGRRVDLSANEGLQNVIFQCFDAQEESVKSAASFALGSIAVGNLDAFLPFILNQISSSPDKQYMLLHSLREVITRHSSAPLALQSQLDIVLGLLFDHCQSERDTVRNVVAECLGRLAAVIKPEELITSLQQRLRSDNKNVRATVVTALKFTLADATPDSVVDKCLQQVMGDFLDRLNDEEHTVRHATLLTFNYAAHNRPMLILASLDRHLPVVYKETLINESLIVRVPCGPFIHVIDHGLENRKAAYECMYTLMETCLERLDIQEFLKHLAGGLKDDSADIKTMCHIMLEHLTQSAGSAVLRALDELIPPMEDTLSKPPKDTSVKQEKERYDELVRSTLRAVLAINRIHGAENSAVLNDFMNNVVARSFSDHYRALQEGKQSERMDLSR